MTNAEPMKLIEGLQETRNLLAGISVPVALLQQVGVPIMAAVENLQHMMEAIDQACAQADAEKAPDPETEEKAIREEDI